MSSSESNQTGQESKLNLNQQKDNQKFQSSPQGETKHPGSSIIEGDKKEYNISSTDTQFKIGNITKQMQTHTEQK
jgi:hypothetical protein